MNKTIFIVSCLHWDKSIAIKAFYSLEEAEAYRYVLNNYQHGRPTVHDGATA